MVHAVRKGRPGESRFKRGTAALFYRLVRRWTDLKIQVDAGDFRLMDRVAVDAICQMPERFRFIRGMAAWVGFNQGTVEYVRHERFAGSTKYPLSKMVHLALTAITSFSFAPLQIASIAGFVLSAITVAAVPVVVLLRILGVGGLGGQTTVLIAVLFLGASSSWSWASSVSTSGGSTWRSRVAPSTSSTPVRSYVTALLGTPGT